MRDRLRAFLMKPHQIIIRSQADAKRAQAIIQHAEIDAEHPIEVVVRPYVRTRSQEQNKCYWKWLAIISEETGQDVESLHFEMKRRYLAPILRRDDPVFAERVDAVINFRAIGQHEAADCMRSHLVDMMSTSGLKVKQFMEYLNEIERFGAEYGIVLDTNAGKGL